MNDIAVLAPGVGGAPEPSRARAELLAEQQRSAAARRFGARAEARQECEERKEQGLFFALDDPVTIAERAARKKGEAQPSAVLVDEVSKLAQTPSPSIAAAFERVIGRSDLLPVAYIAHGVLTARAVVRIVTTFGQGEVGYATGFLVAPDLVITNHHVFPDPETADLSVVQFNYQYGLDGQMEHFETARVDRNRYLSNQDLDYAIAGITLAPGARPATVLPLIASPAKIVNGEAVSIIEHPRGEAKQVALRDNEVIDVMDGFLHYRTDTERGSSGSPVFNDEWEVVALHHAGVPGGGTGWVANEGVRISRIVADLRKAEGLSPAARQMVDEILEFGAASPIPGAGRGPASSPAPEPARTAGQAAEEGSRQSLPLAIEGKPYIADVSITLRAAPAPSAPPAKQPEGLVQDALSSAQAAAGGNTQLPGFIDDIRAGDVFLYSGTGILSEGIKFFTNSDVSHAALYLGAGGLIGEAVDAGLIRDTREQSFPGHEWVLVHRFTGSADLAPVLERASFYLDRRLKYGYQQLVLLGMLLLFKKIRPAGIVGKMVQAVSVAAAEALDRFIERGRELMICSEFVYRAYDEAVPGIANPFRLVVPGVAREAYRPSGSAFPAIEAGSIAATMLADKTLVDRGFTEAAESMRTQLPLDQARLEQQAKGLLAEYLAEQRFGRPHRPAPVADLPSLQLAAAVSRFAISLAAARHQAEGAAREEAFLRAAAPTPEGRLLPPALQALFSSPADFVTPADLRRSPSLAQVGRIY